MKGTTSAESPYAVSYHQKDRKLFRGYNRYFSFILERPTFYDAKGFLEQIYAAQMCPVLCEIKQ